MSREVKIDGQRYSIYNDSDYSHIVLEPIMVPGAAVKKRFISIDISQIAASTARKIPKGTVWVNEGDEPIFTEITRVTCATCKFFRSYAAIFNDDNEDHDMGECKLKFSHPRVTIEDYCLKHLVEDD